MVPGRAREAEEEPRRVSRGPWEAWGWCGNARAGWRGAGGGWRPGSLAEGLQGLDRLQRRRPQRGVGDCEVGTPGGLRHVRGKETGSLEG